MSKPSRVHWVGLQVLIPPSVHSALMLSHARNVHTYGYKHSSMKCKLVADYPTFLTYMTLAKVRDSASSGKNKHYAHTVLNGL